MTEFFNDFPSDVHRRVCGNLAQPRTLRSLVEVLHADQHCPLGHGDADLVERVLRELQASGDVVDLGALRTSRDLVYSPRSNDQAISLHPEKEANLVARAEAQPDRYLGDGHQFILSEQGYAKLTGPAPPEQIPEPLPVEAEPAELGWLRGRLLRRGKP